MLLSPNYIPINEHKKTKIAFFKEKSHTKTIRLIIISKHINEKSLCEIIELVVKIVEVFFLVEKKIASNFIDSKIYSFFHV